MGLYNPIQKGSEMPAYFLSRNAAESIKISDKDLATLQDKDTLCKLIQKFVTRRTG